MAESNDLKGRTPTFHDTDAGYILPNDPAEHSRLHDQHLSLVALVNNRVVHAPVSDPHTVLDIGCGTGIVTRYLGSTQFPNASHVYGIDLTPVPAPQPSEKQAPNVSFVCGDFCKLSGADPRLQPASADFVYSRMLEFGMTDWPGYVAEVFKTLKPGGWFELGDYIEDVFFSDNRTVNPREDWEWLRVIREGGKRQCLDLDVGRHHKGYMEDAGFVDVKTWEYKVPFWRGAEKELPGSEKVMEHVIDDKWGFYWHLIPKLLEGGAYEEGDVERLRQEAVRDMREEVGKYMVFCITIGRKPDALNGEEQ